MLEQLAGRGGSKAALKEAVGLLRMANKRVQAAERRAEERRHRTSWVRTRGSFLSSFSRVRVLGLTALYRW